MNHRSEINGVCTLNHRSEINGVCTLNHRSEINGVCTLNHRSSHCLLKAENHGQNCLSSFWINDVFILFSILKTKITLRYDIYIWYSHIQNLHWGQTKGMVIYKYSPCKRKCIIRKPYPTWTTQKGRKYFLTASYK
jgi:hypothetical protein